MEASGGGREALWSIAVKRNLNPVHMIKKILLKTESVMIYKKGHLKSKDADLINLLYCVSQ